MKVGTRLYDCRYRWGVSFENKDGDREEYPIGVKFEKYDFREIYTIYGESEIGEDKFLSLTEYNFIDGGFTPINSEPPLEIGDMVYCWNHRGVILNYSKLIAINEDFAQSFRINDVFFKYASKEIPQWFIDKNK